MSKERLMELQEQYLEGEIKEGSPEDQERRKLFFRHVFEGNMYKADGYGNRINLFSNMRPCLSDCENCGKKSFINEENEFNEDGHTGWGVIGNHGAMFNSSGYHFSFCSEKCWNEYSENSNKAWKKILNSSYSDFPDMMDVKDFEDFTVWYANGFLKEMSEDEEEKLKNSNPFFLHPQFFAAELRKNMMPHMNDYVEHLDSGYTISHSGQYTFNKPIPKKEVVRILRLN